MLDSPPASPKTVRHDKRSRPSSKGEMSVGELSQEDIGYDGDVEVVHPDEVEEPESESEDDDSVFDLRRLLWPDADQELADKMKRLGWRSKDDDGPDGRSLEKPGTKRLSRETGSNPNPVNHHGKRTEMEISDMGDANHKQPYAKRRKDTRLSMARQTVKDRKEMQTDTSEHTDGRDRKPLPTCDYSVSVAPGAGGDEEMDFD